MDSGVRRYDKIYLIGTDESRVSSQIIIGFYLVVYRASQARMLRLYPLHRYYHNGETTSG